MNTVRITVSKAHTYAGKPIRNRVVHLLFRNDKSHRCILFENRF